MFSSHIIAMMDTSYYFCKTLIVDTVIAFSFMELAVYLNGTSTLETGECSTQFMVGITRKKSRILPNLEWHLSVA
jgi:hypothetical protein